ncbi:hypothetical protein STENM327S_08340 [Streptomyces tendae]
MTSTSRPAPLHIKIVIDAAAPHAQADFWAAALHYEVEDNSALIGKLLGFGAVPAELTVESHGRRAWRDLAAVRHPDDPFQEESGTGLGRRLLFQRVHFPAGGPCRLRGGGGGGCRFGDRGGDRFGCGSRLRCGGERAGHRPRPRVLRGAGRGSGVHAGRRSELTRRRCHRAGGVPPAGSGRARSVNVGTLSRTGATERRTRVCRSCRTGASADASTTSTVASAGAAAGVCSGAVGTGSAARWLEPSGSTRRGRSSRRDGRESWRGRGDRRRGRGGGGGSARRSGSPRPGPRRPVPRRPWTRAPESPSGTWTSIGVAAGSGEPSARSCSRCLSRPSRASFPHSSAASVGGSRFLPSRACHACRAPTVESLAHSRFWRHRGVTGSFQEVTLGGGRACMTRSMRVHIMRTQVTVYRRTTLGSS